MLTTKEAAELFKLAKDAVSTYLREGCRIEPPSILNEGLREKRLGVFITLSRLDDTSGKRETVACCGIPLPTKPLIETIIDVAVSAAVRAKLLSTMKADEIDMLRMEVSIITQQKPIRVNNPVRYIQKIKIGEDGLMVERGIFKGILLPHVPVEKGWDATEFLSECCTKAGLPPDSWLGRDVKIFKFKTLTLSAN